MITQILKEPYFINGHKSKRQSAQLSSTIKCSI